MHIFLAILGVLLLFALLLIAALLWGVVQNLESLLLLLEPPLPREKVLQKFLMSSWYGKFGEPGHPTKPPSLTESALTDLSWPKEMTQAPRDRPE